VVWDFDTCVLKMRAVSLAQAEAEKDFQIAGEQYADAERTYRVELAKRMTVLRADGMPATLIPDLAKGDERIALLKMERDSAKTLQEAATQALWRHTADRRDTQRIVDYSMAVNTGRAMD